MASAPIALAAAMIWAMSRWAATGVSPLISTRFVSHAHMFCPRLDAVMDRNRRDAHLGQRAHDTAGDLAAIGHQNLVEQRRDHRLTPRPSR
jgi:hypothetical protein